ncbi:MAG: hypothetical protein PHI98_16000 [Eubacteriales bacterium]|nr:hypothetical protein [Eubacteriales bacterium]
MGLLDGFKSFSFEEGVPYVSITANGVTFNKSVVLKLDYARHVLLLINDEEKQIALQACDEQAKNAAPFFKEKKSGVISVRWNGKDLLNTLQDIMGWDLKSKAYRVDGSFVKSENAILFDLNRATELK